MAIKLIKACKELNVGMSTVAEFCAKQGREIAIDPNTQLDDDLYLLLAENFNQDMALKIQSSREKRLQEENFLRILTLGYTFTDDPAANRAFLDTHGWNDLQSDVFFICGNRLTLVPKDQHVDSFQYWLMSDIEKKSPQAITDAGTIQRSELCEPSGTILVTPYSPSIKKVIKSPIVQRTSIAKTPSDGKTLSGPRVVGSIDLSSLNQATHSKAKEQRTTNEPQVGQTVEGRVKNIVHFGVFVDCGFMDGLVPLKEIANKYVTDACEHVQVGQTVRVKILELDKRNNRMRLSLRQADNKATVFTSMPAEERQEKKGIPTGRSASSEDVKKVWKYYIDIQEYLLQQKSKPIDIKPETIDFNEKEGKFWVDIDDSTDLHIKQIVKEYLKIEDFDCKSDCIQADADLWNSMPAHRKNELQEKLSQYGADIGIVPTIDIDIQYGKDVERIDQMTIDNIRQLDGEMQEGTTIKGHIEDEVTFISRIRFDHDYYVHYLFGEHAMLSQQSTAHKYSRNLRYKNTYIEVPSFYEYSKSIGLVFTRYYLLFRVKDDDACEYLREKYEVFKQESPNSVTYNMSEKAFVFVREVSKKNKYKDIIEQEINQNIHTFIKALGVYYTSDNVEIECVFNYIFSRDMLEETLAKQLYSLVSAEGMEGVSISPYSRQVGIDFNWKTEDIQEKIDHITALMPGVTIELQDSHRFKCRVQSTYVGYERLKSDLEETFENISVTHNELTQTVHVCLEYDYTYYANLHKMLVTKLEALGYDKSQLDVKDNEDGKIRLNYAYNNEDRIQDMEATLLELRTADFAFDAEETTIPFGRLLRVEYPKLYFDITYPQENRKAKIDELLNEQKVSVVVPALTGDREKLTRLKNTYGRALSGEGLQNGNLSRFMFDSSLATVTKDIADIIKADGVPYLDMKRNILNPHINPSQIKAILKAIYAEDLAVIQGPPGTGKSTAISELIWQLIRIGEKQGNASERILLTSETNLAVDNAIARTVNDKTNLIKPIRFGDDEKLAPEGQQFSIKLMKEWVEDGEMALEATGTDDETGAREERSHLILRNWLDNISRRSFGGGDIEDNEIVDRWKKVLEKPNQKIRELVFKNYQAGCNVIGATCSSIGIQRADNDGVTSFYKKYSQLFASRGRDVPVEFTHVIQDESSKATPAELIQPFVYGQRAIVIGDHRQLPPMLDQEDIENSLVEAIKIAQTTEESENIKHLQDIVHNNFEELEVSHFQRLYENIDPSLKATFNLQYRMHPAINEVIEQFYKEDGGLHCGWTMNGDMGVDDPDITNPASRYHGICIDGLIDENTHVLFVNTNSPEMVDGTSRVNYGEIDVVDKLLAKFEESSSYQEYLKKFTKEEDRQIGIISFYGKQVRQLQNIARKHSTLPPSRVSTVDRFQGMERNIIIVSMVRSDRIQTSRNQTPNVKKYPETGGYPKQTSLGFAKSPNRLNVALSRARRLLIIVGNELLFSKLDIYKNLFQTIQNNPNNRVINVSDL